MLCLLSIAVDFRAGTPLQECHAAAIHARRVNKRSAAFVSGLELL
jgi:hypothetical protein